MLSTLKKKLKGLFQFFKIEYRAYDGEGYLVSYHDGTNLHEFGEFLTVNKSLRFMRRCIDQYTLREGDFIGEYPYDPDLLQQPEFELNLIDKKTGGRFVIGRWNEKDGYDADLKFLYKECLGL